MNIVIIQGHPDKDRSHYCHAVAAAYTKSAESQGHNIKHIIVADIDFPLLRSKADFDGKHIPAVIKQAQDDISWAKHIVIIYPLWLGTMPALLKGFIEQVFRPGFAMTPPEPGQQLWKKLLTGKSARIIVTMGMPAFLYRWFFGAHSVKNLQRNVLSFVGIKPIRTTLIGMVDAGNENKLAAYLGKIKKIAANE